MGKKKKRKQQLQATSSAAQNTTSPAVPFAILSPMRQEWLAKHLLALLGILFLTFIVYVHSGTCTIAPFERGYIANQQWVDPSTSPISYSPLTNLINDINFSFFPDNYMYWRVVNILIYLFLISLIYIWMHLLLPSQFQAKAVTLLWAVLPIHTHTVDFFTSRHTLLMAVTYALLFMLFSFQHRSRTHKYLHGSFALAIHILALCISPAALLIPLLIFFLIRALPREEINDSISNKLLAGHVMLSMCSAFIILFKPSIGLLPYFINNPVDTWANLAILIVLPFKTIPLFNSELPSLAKLLALGGWLATFMGGVLIFYRRFRLAAFFWVLFFLTWEWQHYYENIFVGSQIFFSSLAICWVAIKIYFLLETKFKYPIRILGVAIIISCMYETLYNHDVLRRDYDYCTRLAQNNPHDLNIIKSNWKYFLEQNKKSEALHFLEIYLAKVPDDIEAKLSLAQIYTLMGKYNESSELVRPILADNPDQPLANSILGQNYYDEANYDKALQFLEKGYQLGDHSPYLLGALGTIYANLDQLENAEKVFIEFMGNNPPADKIRYGYNNLAIITDRLGKFTDSIRYYRQALDLEPNDPDLNFNLGVTYFHQKDILNARMQWQRTLALKPGYPKAINAMEKLAILEKLNR